MTQPLESATVAIQADFSGFAQELERGLRRAFAAIIPQVNRAAGQIGEQFTRNGEQAERSVGELARTVDRQMDAVVRDAHRGGAAVGTIGKSASLAGPLLFGLGAAGAAGLGALTTFGLQAAAAQEQTLIALNSLLGSAEKGTQVFGELREFAAKTPFELPQLTDVTKRFLAFNQAVGLSDDALIPFLTTVGNIASVTGSGAEGMSRVALALGQISSKGKLSLEELGQISEALPGFSGIAAIAAAKGITTAQAMEAISKGEIGAAEGVAALIEGMNKFPGAASAMEKQSQTLLGVFSTFKDELSAALIGGFEPVIPSIKEALTGATPIIKEAIGGLAPVIGDLLASVLPLLGELVRAIVPIITPLIKGLREGLAALGPALIPLGEALGHIAEAIAPLLPVVGKLIAALVTALVPVIDALVPSLDLIVEAFVGMLPTLLPLIPSLGQLAASLLLLLVPLIQLITLLARNETVVKAFGIVLGLLAQAITILANALAAAAEFLTNINWAAVGQAIVGAFNAVVDFFRQLPGRIIGFLVNLPQLLARSALAALNAMAFAVGFGIATIIKFFIALPGRVARLVSVLWAGVRRLFAAGVAQTVAILSALPGRAAALFTRMVSRAVGIVRALPGRVVDFIRSISTLITKVIPQLISAGYEIARGIIDGIIAGIRALGGNIGGILKDILANALRGAKRAFGIGSPSKVWADQVGAQITAGIVQGIADGTSAISDLLAPIQTALTPGRLAGPGRTTPALAGLGLGTRGVRVISGTPTPVRVVLEIKGDKTRHAGWILEELRRAVRLGGGNVQTVVGNRSDLGKGANLL